MTERVAIPRSYWLSTERMTVVVDADARGVIVWAPPIVRRFVGQPLDNLIGWMRRQPGFRAHAYEEGS